MDCHRAVRVGHVWFVFRLLVCNLVDPGAVQVERPLRSGHTWYSSCHDRWLQLDTGTIDTGTTRLAQVAAAGGRRHFVRSGHCGVPGGDCGGPSGGRGEEWDVKHKTIGV